MTTKRLFSRNGYQHLYQISVDGSLLFCTVADYIYLFTLICVSARKYHIHITGVSIMFNHFHIQASMDSLDDMESFMYAVTWTFAFVYNRHFGLKGKVFHKPYGSAMKVKEKRITSNSIYIANNASEKKAVDSAWDYRWNFLRYAPRIDAATGRIEYSRESRHPFSEEFNPLEASKDMLYLVKKVRMKAAEGDPIDYEFFDSQRYEGLSEKEHKQLIDIIIVEYNVIDYEPMLRKYGSVEKFCKVLDEVEGSEYDLDDDKDAEDYRHYVKMIKIAAEEGYDMRVKRWAGADMPRDLLDRLVKRFRKEVGASALEIKKLLKIKQL